MYAKIFNTGYKNSRSTSLSPYNGTPLLDTELEFTEPYNRLNPTIVLIGRQPAVRYVTLSENADYSTPYHYKVVGAPVYDAGVTIVNLELDVLATYKTQILSSTQYVLRATDYSARNYDIMDEAAPNFGVSYNTQTYAAQDPFASRIGSYVIQYVGTNGNSIAVMDQANFQKLCRYLWQDFNDLDGAGELITAIFDPMQYITDVKYYPMSVEQFYAGGNLPSAYDTLELGNHSINSLHSSSPVIAYPLFSTYGNVQPTIPPSIIYNVSVPKHPSGNTTTKKYLYGGKYSVYTMRLPGGDWFSLDSSILVNAVALQITARVDVLSGLCHYDIYGISSDYGLQTTEESPTTASSTIWRVASYSCQIGIPWVIVGAYAEMPSAGGAVASLATGMTYGGITGLIGAGLGLITQAATSALDHNLAPNPTVKGGLNGVQSLRHITTVMLKYAEVGTIDGDRIGYPVQDVVQLSTCSGYCICANAKLQVPAFPVVSEQLEQYLNGGFYIE